MFKHNLQKLIKIFESSSLSSIEVTSFWGFRKIRLAKNNANSIETLSTSSLGSTKSKVAKDNSLENTPDSQVVLKNVQHGNSEVSNEENIKILSPLVGTFYISPKPGSPPFISEGDSIEIGQTLCIVEAMKIFNEIDSEYDGKIIKILVEDGTPIEYDQPLMILKK